MKVLPRMPSERQGPVQPQAEAKAGRESAIPGVQRMVSARMDRGGGETSHL